MTAEEFTRDEEARARLAGILADPVLQSALRVLQSEMEAKPGAVTDANPVVAAAKYQQLAGASAVINGLHRLTRPMTPVRTLTPKRLHTEPVTE